MKRLLDTDLVDRGLAYPQNNDLDSPILVLGVGNLLMGDEGVGVHVLRSLECRPIRTNVRLLDGGTGGANLLGEFEKVRSLILVDATRDGSPAGTIGYRYRRHSLIGDIPTGLSAHDFGLKDLFAAAALIEILPELHIFTIAVQSLRPMCTELSPEVAAAGEIVGDAIDLLAGRLSATA